MRKKTKKTAKKKTRTCPSCGAPMLRSYEVWMMVASNRALSSARSTLKRTHVCKICDAKSVKMLMDPPVRFPGDGP